jgi:ribosome biogenesis protein SSF1/2
MNEIQKNKVRRGKVESEVVELVADLRKLMSPHTALNFKEDTKNSKLNKSLSHYAKELTGSLGITHILSISQNDSKLALRLARTPLGPTLSFKIQQFSLCNHVRKVQRRPFDINSAASKITTHPPIVVTNNFGDATAPPHVKLMRITFQNMFPAINVATVKLRNCRRVVLFNFIRREEESIVNANGQTEEDEEVEIRHYAIRAAPVGINRKVKRIIQAKIPNLSKLDDISDYITGTTSSGAKAPAAIASGSMSDSEAEDETTHVVLPEKYAGKGNIKSQKSALKLVEIGPRLRLKLTKVERGLASGDVMYHAYIHKDPEEVKAQREKIEKAAAVKKRRKEEQEENVRRKKEAIEEKRERKKRRKEEREQAVMEELRGKEADDDQSDDE